MNYNKYESKMNKHCIFTICAKNYIGLAQALEKSVMHYNNDVDFYIVVSDEFDTGMEPKVADNVLIAKNILEMDDDLWINMAFKYNLTEFATSIKPFSIEYFFKQKYDTVCYMDPDTYLFSDFSYIHDKLSKYLVVTAPHITIPEYPYTGDLPDRSFLFNGISNLGFGGFKNDPKTLNLLKWWEDRLTKMCFGEMLWAVCTDQKWTDFFPAFLGNDECFFSNNLGLNVAPWNYFERKIIKDGNTYYVVSRSGDSNRKDKLVFCHFAGYNYKELSSGIVNNKNRMRISNLKEYKDVTPLIDEYVKFIFNNRDLFNKFLDLPYSYATFDNGVKIDKLHRRLYNGINVNFNYKQNPFVTSGKNAFFMQLKSKGLIHKNVDKVKIDDVSQMNDEFVQKLRYLYKILRIFYKLIGYKKYVLFLQFIRRLSLYDNNTYLLGKKYENYTLK